MKRYFFILMLVLILIFISCKQTLHRKEKIKISINDTTLHFKIHNFTIKILPYLDLAYSKEQKTFPNVKITDGEGIPLNLYRGKLFYHPVALSSYAFKVLNVFYTTKDTSLLLFTEKIAKKLVDYSMSLDTCLYYPYNTDFYLHGKEDKSNTMRAPWYSSMAQGQVLSLFSRLYEFTGDSIYITYSRKTFNSLTKIKNIMKDSLSPWFAIIDSAGYLWFEEYPQLPPNHTLNGMIFTLFGIYDYYRITKDSTALKFLRGGLTTIKHYLPLFRNEGDYSYYCLTHKVKSKSYHYVHISQLKELYKITGDKYFLQMAQLFEKDAENKND